MADKRRSEASGEIREHLRAHGSPPFHLSATSRGRILARAREARSEQAGLGAGLHGFPAVSLTAAAVAFLILSAGFLTEGPGFLPDVPDGAAVTGGHGLLAEADGQESDVWVDYRDNQVILTWLDQGRPVAVRQGGRIQEARTAPPVLVEGTRLVQKGAPAPDEAVFYVVE